MRIALVHSFYHPRVPGGENAVVRDEATALLSAGHEVFIAASHTEELESTRFYVARSAYTVATGRGRSPEATLRDFRPDVVHVHNTFPNWGRQWVYRWSGPLVTTLHNYRIFCANGVFYRDGQQCFDCLDHIPLAAVRHGCYRSSATATAPLAIASVGSGSRDPLLRRADRVIVLSRHMEQLLRTHNVGPDRIVVKRNFLPAALTPARRVDYPGAEPGRWLFAGQLIGEKGAVELVQRWPADVPLDLVGEGPIEQQVRAAAQGKRIALCGRIPREAVLTLMREAVGLVFPSRCLEGAPLVYVEALASGLPVLAFDGNVVADQVEEEGTGVRVRWDDDLNRLLPQIETRFRSLRAHCRDTFERSYTERAHLAAVTGIYAAAMRRSGSEDEFGKSVE